MGCNKLVGTLSGNLVRGYSAYDVAVKNGFTGTETEWLASLKGEKGEAGEKGEKGDPGESGSLSEATAEECRWGRVSDKYISPYTQAWATFYGLAQAAGDTTQQTSGNGCGWYTDDAKAAIKAMIGVDEVPDWQSNVEITESSGTYTSDKTFADIMDAVSAGKVITAHCDGLVSVSMQVNLQASPKLIYFNFVTASLASDGSPTGLEFFRIVLSAADTVTKEASKYITFDT